MSGTLGQPPLFRHLDEATIRQGIADWYDALYQSSGDINAACESIDQRLACIAAALRATGEPNDGLKGHLMVTAAIQIDMMLQAMEPTVATSARPLTLVRVFSRMKDRFRAVLASRDLEFPATFQTTLGRARRRFDHMSRAYEGEVAQNSDPPEPVAQSRPLHERPLEELRDPSDPAPSVPGAAEWRAELQRVRNKSNSRDYGEAEELVKAALQKLGTSSDIVCGKSSNVYAQRWAFQHDRVPEQRSKEIERLVELLRRFQLVKLYRAEAARCVATHLRDGGTSPEATKLEKTRETYLDEAENIYRFAAEVMRYVDDTEIITREQAFLRSNAGIMLARRRRHAEAHRKYNEAYGYLSRDRGPSQSLRFATVDVRRGETFVSQLQESRPGDRQTTPNRLGLLYDAIASIDRAAYKARGQSVNSVWYSWLHELELSVCVELAREGEHGETGEWSVQELFARCRDGGSLGDWFRASLDHGLFLGSTDPFRCARYVDLACEFLGAKTVMRNEIEPHNLRRISELLAVGARKLGANGFGDATDPNVVRYAEIVLARAAVCLRSAPTR